MKRWMLLVALTTACGSGPSEGQCKQLLEHLVDLEFKKAGAAATTDALKAELAKQKAAVMETMQPDFVALCTKSTAEERVSCALAATDLDGVAACDKN